MNEWIERCKVLLAKYKDGTLTAEEKEEFEEDEELCRMIWSWFN